MGHVVTYGDDPLLISAGYQNGRTACGACMVYPKVDPGPERTDVVGRVD